MKRFMSWLKPDAQQSAANEEDQGDVGVRSEQKTEDEYTNDSSFSWFGINQADSSIFDTGSFITEKSEDKNAASHKTPDSEGDSLCNAEENIGVDPYNTGRFDAEGK